MQSLSCTVTQIQGCFQENRTYTSQTNHLHVASMQHVSGLWLYKLSTQNPKDSSQCHAPVNTRALWSEEIRQSSNVCRSVMGVKGQRGSCWKHDDFYHFGHQIKKFRAEFFLVIGYKGYNPYRMQTVWAVMLIKCFHMFGLETLDLKPVINHTTCHFISLHCFRETCNVAHWHYGTYFRPKIPNFGLETSCKFVLFKIKLQL